jgi:hypothetical protein
MKSPRSRFWYAALAVVVFAVVDQWPVFGLHAAMNLWEVVAVDDTALGGWLANGARLATIVVAVLLTIYKDRIWKPLPSETASHDDEPGDRPGPEVFLRELGGLQRAGRGS